MNSRKICIILLSIASAIDAFSHDDYALIQGLDDDPEVDIQDIQEAGCPQINHLRNVTLKHLLGQWYLPFMSKHYIRYMAQSAHGKYMKRSSMGGTCIKVNIKELLSGPPNHPETTLLFQSKCPYSSSELTLACKPSGSYNTKWYCHDIKGKSSDGDSFVYVVDTDGKTWALIVRCFPTNGMSWAILSKVKQLKPSLVKSLLRDVQSMGFKLNNIVEIPYSKCMQKP